jgi:hypothetical protein
MDAHWPTIAELAERRVLFVGFDIVCPRCGADEWRAVDDVEQTVTCLGCRESIPLSTSARAGQREPHWSYTLNRALVWPLEQDVLPVVFAVQALVRRAKDASHFVFGVLPKGPNGPEYDAIVVVDEEVFVVEGKSGGVVGEAEIARTVGMATRLEGTAVFATLSEWSDESARSIAAGSLDGRPPLTFARMDLIRG